MIKIRRTKCPPELDTNSQPLSEHDYTHDNVLTCLLNMQYHKCCYCEKDLQLIGQSAMWIEHFIARSDDCFKDVNGNINWSQVNAWANLLYSCSTCNNSKGSKNPFDKNCGERRLIDPSYSRIDPEKHIDFIINGTAIIYKVMKNSILGRNTIENLKLRKRTDIYPLLRQCKRKIDALFDELVDALVVNNVAMVNSRINDLSKKTSANEPHAAFSRKYLLQKINIFNIDDIQILNKHLELNIKPISINIANGSEIIN